MDLFAVAVHEFGHAIGLSHVAAMNSVMQPYYQGPVGDPLRFRLPYEDRVRVWQLYGKYWAGTVLRHWPWVCPTHVMQCSPWAPCLSPDECFSYLPHTSYL